MSKRTVDIGERLSKIHKRPLTVEKRPRGYYIVDSKTGHTMFGFDTLVLLERYLGKCATDSKLHIPSASETYR